MTIRELANSFNLTNGNTTISKADFEANFYRTANGIDFTFNGWDGKSYDGETRHARIWMCNVDGFMTSRFVKVGRAVHMVDEGSQVEELATGKKHHTVDWLVDVARA